MGSSVFGLSRWIYTLDLAQVHVFTLEQKPKFREISAERKRELYFQDRVHDKLLQC